MHGSRLSSAQWAPQVPLLRDHVDLTLVDLPGHGERVHEPFSKIQLPCGDRTIQSGPEVGRVLVQHLQAPALLVTEQPGPRRLSQRHVVGQVPLTSRLQLTRHPQLLDAIRRH